MITKTKLLYDKSSSGKHNLQRKQETSVGHSGKVELFINLQKGIDNLKPCSIESTLESQRPLTS